MPHTNCRLLQKPQSFSEEIAGDNQNLSEGDYASAPVKQKREALHLLSLILSLGFVAAFRLAGFAFFLLLRLAFLRFTFR
jgi:hypothetical protein